MSENAMPESPTCGVCAHFEAESEREQLVQISIRGAGETDAASCGHPAHRPLRLRVRPGQSCSAFEPSRLAG